MKKTITRVEVLAEIVSYHYFVGGDGVYGAAHKAGDHEVQTFPAALDMVTICIVTLRCGVTVVGTAFCADPEKFSAELGREAARADAIRQLWPFIIFRQKDREFEGEDSQ